MAKSSLLWIDPEPSAAMEFANSLNETSSFSLDHFAGSAAEGIEAIALYRPEVIVTGLVLRGGDGFSVLSAIGGRRGYDPLVLVYTAVRDEGLLDKCHRLGADAVELRPLPPKMLTERLEALLKRKKGLLSYEKETLEAADRLLHELGSPVHLAGYRLLREAAAMAAERQDGSALNLYSEFYPALAKNHGLSVGSVERAMRSAIENTWSKGNMEAIDRYFGETIAASRGKPTNAEFIAMAAAHIRARTVNKVRKLRSLIAL